MKTIEITITERIDCEPPKYVRFQINLGEIDSLPTFLKGVALEQILTSMKEKMEEENYQHQATMGIIKSDIKILENALTKIKKLEADKAELLEALEKIYRIGNKPYRNTRNEEIEIDRIAYATIQKHKQ